MNRILVITTEPLPLAGGFTTGAGLRAWGLAEGLKSKGFPVTIATPLEGDQAIEQSKELAPDGNIRFFKRPDLGNLIADINPDVVVMQHWGLMYAVPPLDCPLVIDLAGPHLLERKFWGNQNLDQDRQEKICALSRADYVICGGEVQREYFLPFLREAGFEGDANCFPVIPFSVPPEHVDEMLPIDTETTFIYGGAFLAWQNPEKPLRWLLDEMDRKQTGRLLFYGGAHPEIDASAGRFVAITQLLRNHHRVEMRGWKPFDELIHDYATQGHVALDLMERNAERELAYTTRTMIYLFCGLPVIYNNYSELTGLISANDCGWCLDPEDEPGFRDLVGSLLVSSQAANVRRDKARNTAMDQNWNKTIEPLAKYCANPVIREKKLSCATETSVPDDVTQSDKNPISGPFLRSIFPKPGKFAGILVYMPVWIVCKYLSFQLNVVK